MLVGRRLFRFAELVKKEKNIKWKESWCDESLKCIFGLVNAQGENIE